nr:immunoglobulin heavy chain junction region [Homo sapiens]
CASSSWLHW